MPKLRFNGPKTSKWRLALAHGAGTGMDSPFLLELARGLGRRGVRVARFEFPYMARRRDGVRAAPDRAPILLQTWRDVVAQLGAADTLCIGGKSMGGRIASMVADELGVRGLVCLGYPFHPPGRSEVTRTEHLAKLRTSCLIIQGTRDPFGTPEEVTQYKLPRRTKVHWIDTGDHSLVPLRRSGLDPAASMQDVIDRVAAFVKALSR
jgi:predicted alpha/beta-hydrolase family hydrolase